MWNRFVERWHLLAREQQISVVVLTICGGLAITLSLFRIQASIKEPFLVRKDTLLAAKKLIGPSEQQKLEKEQRTDTDGDGLSDWDEVNTYKTNPNLRDTCGDGTPDNIRVALGKDVACSGIAQPGYIDTSSIQKTNALSPTGLDLPTQKFSPTVAPGMPNLTGATPEDQQALIEKMLPRDPATIRSMLKGKVDDARLEKISDEDLLKLYDAALKEQNAQAQTQTAQTEADPEATSADTPPDASVTEPDTPTSP